MINVSYTIMCKNDVRKELSLTEILANEKVIKSIKSEFATGLRNLVLSQKEDTQITLKTKKEVYEFSVSKDDFADLLEFAEEDARKHKRIKKECDGVEIVNIITVD